MRQPGSLLTFCLPTDGSLVWPNCVSMEVAPLETSSSTEFLITSQCEAAAAVKHQSLAWSPDGIFLPAQLLSDHKTQPNEGRALRKHH